MRPTLLIHIVDGPEARVEWLACGGDQQSLECTDFGHGTLDDIGDRVQGRDVRVLLSSPDIVLTSVRVPGRQRQQIAAALPFLIEEQFIEEVEGLHFAIGPRDPDGLVHAAVVSHERIAYWRQRLADAGIEPHSIYPGVLCLPFEDGGWTVAEHHGLVLARTGAAAGFTCARAHLEMLLGQMAEPDRPETIRLHTFSDSQSSEAEQGVELNVDGVTNEWRHHDVRLLEVMAGTLSAKGQINLLQGPYSRSTKLNQVWIKWRPAAILAGLLLTTLFANDIARVMELKARNERLHDDIRAAYSRAFPDEKHIVNPQVQMQRHLDALRSGSGASNAAWIMETLDRSSPVLTAMPGLVLQRLTYKNDAFSLRLDLPNLASVEQLKNKLAALDGVSVEILTASANNGQVTANLLLKPKAS